MKITEFILDSRFHFTNGHAVEEGFNVKLVHSCAPYITLVAYVLIWADQLLLYHISLNKFSSLRVKE